MNKKFSTLVAALLVTGGSFAMVSQYVGSPLTESPLAMAAAANLRAADVASEAKAHLLVFTPDAKENGNEGVKAYLESGEAADIDKGYKTSIRDQWWVIPSIKLSDALFLRRNNLYPKFVLNEAGAYTTDTMHRVFIHEGVNKKAFVASYYNSLSFAFAEIHGRNFGGGCLELMPSEVEEIFLPYFVENADTFDKIDTMLRA